MSKMEQSKMEQSYWFKSMESKVIDIINTSRTVLEDKDFRSHYGVDGFSQKSAEDSIVLKISNRKNEKDILKLEFTSFSATFETSTLKVSVEFGKQIAIGGKSALRETQYLPEGKRTIKHGENPELQKPLKQITRNDGDMVALKLLKNVQNITPKIPARIPLKSDSLFWKIWEEKPSRAPSHSLHT